MSAKADDKVYVTNPLSGRRILRGGPTYKQVVKQLTARQRREMEQTAEKRQRAKAQRRSKDIDSSDKISDHVRRLYELGIAEPESLGQTLDRTTQPALRRKLRAQMKKEGQGRGFRTRGWAARAPQPGRPRHTLRKACGDEAFLMPREEKFPIMAKCGSGTDADKCECKIDCGGLQSAYVRARQYKYDRVAELADRLLAAKCEQ